MSKLRVISITRGSASLAYSASSAADVGRTGVALPPPVVVVTESPETDAQPSSAVGQSPLAPAPPGVPALPLEPAAPAEPPSLPAVPLPPAPAPACADDPPLGLPGELPPDPLVPLRPALPAPERLPEPSFSLVSASDPPLQAMNEANAIEPSAMVFMVLVRHAESRSWLDRPDARAHPIDHQPRIKGVALKLRARSVKGACSEHEQVTGVVPEHLAHEAQLVQSQRAQQQAGYGPAQAAAPGPGHPATTRHPVCYA